MQQQLGQVALVVEDYDEAIEFFVTKLKFRLLEDTPQEGKRWVVVAPQGDGGAHLLLAKAKDKNQQQYVGMQTGGRVAFFLYTDDFWRDYQDMKKAGVKFIDQPREEDYGRVIVFFDLYGNKWDFIERAKQATTVKRDEP